MNKSIRGTFYGNHIICTALYGDQGKININFLFELKSSYKD